MINIAESDRGRLVGIDLTNIPFIPKRLFIVDNVPIDGIRSDHAHYKDHQMLFCTNGSLEIELIHKNLVTTKQTIQTGQFCELLPLTWSKIRFLQNNSSFLCVCSETYHESDYIRDYNNFLDIIKAINV